MILALILFIITYILLLVFPKYRAYIALTTAVIFIAVGILPLGLVDNAINWNVLMMIAGTMGIVALFIESHMPSLLADIIIEKMSNVKWAIVSMSLFAGIVSAFIDNVATVLIVAPVAITISKKLKISPVASVIAIAISSNLQGAATLVGDATSILLGGQANMDFFDFFWFKGKPGIFWAVELGALASILVIFFVFRKEKQPISIEGRTKVTDYFPSVLLLLTILLLIVASFIPESLKPAETNGYIVMSLLFVGLVKKYVTTKKFRSLKETVREIDYFTLLLLAGLFIIVRGIGEVGIITEISNFIKIISNGNIFLAYTIIVFASVLLSAFIDNIPYVATMLPVVAALSLSLNIEPYLLYFGLLIGATLGGNITPIGASANITAIGMLRKYGHEVSAKTFMKLGIPFTFSAVVVGYAFIWIFWS